MKDKELYEKPEIEVIEFELEDSIAISGESGLASGLICSEGLN